MTSSVTTLKLPKINENLKPLIKAKKENNTLFKDENLRKVGLQQHLSEIYKPITEETKAIASKIEEGTKQASQFEQERKLKKRRKISIVKRN